MLMTSARITSTSPSASAVPKSPCDVYSATAVVSVRVEPRMLPPRIIAAPTSATTWPKAAVMTAASAKRASRATVQAVRQGPAPSVSAVRRTRGSTPCTAAADRAAAIGKASEEHTSELQSPYDLVCRLLLEKKKQIVINCTGLILLWLKLIS